MSELRLEELTGHRSDKTAAGNALEAELACAQQRIEREQQAAEAARVEAAKARLRAEAQAERISEQAAQIDRLRARSKLSAPVPWPPSSVPPSRRHALPMRRPLPMR